MHLLAGMDDYWNDQGGKANTDASRILHTVDVLERKRQFLERRNQERCNTVDSHRDKYQA